MIRLRSIAQLPAVVELLAHELWHMGKGLWDEVGKRLPEEQKRHWDARPRKQSLITQERRRQALFGRRTKRGDYYQRNKPNSRAQADRPYWEWTGGLRKATEKPTRKEALEMVIDTARNYSGPIKLDDPVGRIIPDPWDLRGVDRVLEAATDVAADQVVRRTEKAFR